MRIRFFHGRSDPDLDFTQRSYPEPGNPIRIRNPAYNFVGYKKNLCIPNKNFVETVKYESHSFSTFKTGHIVHLLI